MKHTESLRKNGDFRKVYNKGKSIANRQLVIYYLPNKLKHNRLGISVSKKVGNSVVRSRVTRLIRESYRLNEQNVENGYDIIIIARATMKGVTYFEAEKSFLHLFNKLGLINS